VVRTLNVGFVGAGGNALAHIGQVSRIPDTQIVGICDVVKDRTEKATRQYGGKPYTDYHKLIDRENMDALYVSIPPFAHGEVEILAAHKGLHLFIEKPVALTMHTGLEVCEAIEEAGVISCVGYQLRYAETVDRAKQFLEDKTVAMVTSNRWGDIPPTPWWRVMAQSGGQLVEQTTHQVDMIRCLAGEIEAVYSVSALRTATHLEHMDIPDVQALTFQFESGAVGSLTTTCALNRGGGYSDLNIIVKDAVLHWNHDSLSTTPQEAGNFGNNFAPLPSIDALFINAVRTNDPSQIRSPYRDALRTLDVTLAANQSAEQGKPVATYFSHH